jgi:hypothetical protein
MHSKIKLAESKNLVNIFKLTGKMIKNKITVLGEYKVLKLTNFKLRKKKYDTKILKQKMKESLHKKKNHSINTDSTSNQDNNENFKLRQKLFQRM